MFFCLWTEGYVVLYRRYTMCCSLTLTTVNVLVEQKIRMRTPSWTEVWFGRCDLFIKLGSIVKAISQLVIVKRKENILVWFLFYCRFLDEHMFITCSRSITISPQLWDVRNLSEHVHAYKLDHGGYEDNFFIHLVNNVEYVRETQQLISCGKQKMLLWDINR